MKIIKIEMPKGGRMLRVCLFGQNEGRWFSRIDLWWIGFRLTKE